mmetsp:Transcript_92148/g.260825  ORF Transcript_92148/g.260825 Transcript_92148/m.260825 type:complete len:133 (-) Transcript_92148:114-512(-)
MGNNTACSECVDPEARNLVAVRMQVMTRDPNDDADTRFVIDQAPCSTSKEQHEFNAYSGNLSTVDSASTISGTHSKASYTSGSVDTHCEQSPNSDSSFDGAPVACEGVRTPSHGRKPMPLGHDDKFAGQRGL